MSKRLNQALVSSLFLSLFSFSAQAGPLCSGYLSDNVEATSSDLATVTEELVAGFNIYSPWYYTQLLKSADEKEIAEFLTTVSDEKLKVIADGIYLGLVNESNLKVDLDQMALQQEAILQSLKAIQNAQIYPVKVVVKHEIFEGKKKIGKVMLAVSAVSALATPVVMYMTGIDNSMIATLGVASFALSSSVVNFLASENREFVEVDNLELTQFILSSGAEGNVSPESYFSSNAEGQLMVGTQYRLVTDKDGKVVIVNAGS